MKGLPRYIKKKKAGTAVFPYQTVPTYYIDNFIN